MFLGNSRDIQIYVYVYFSALGLCELIIHDRMDTIPFLYLMQLHTAIEPAS